jgi:hypothetical protein
MTDTGRVQILEDIADAANELQSWLAINSGTNADFPVEIRVDNDEDLVKLCMLLQRMERTLKPYRKALNL